MTPYSYVLAALSGVQLSLLVWAGASLRGTRMKMPFVMLGASMLVVNLLQMFADESSGGVPLLSSISFLALLAVSPLCALAVLTVLRDDWLVQKPLLAVFMLLSVSPIAAYGLWAGWGAGQVYGVYFASVVPVVWLSLALAECIAVWARSSLRKNIAFACVTGVAFLILSGPVYAIELEAIGWSWAVGSLPAAPFAYAAFFWAARKKNPLAFDIPGGRIVKQAAESVEPGLHMIDERRPKHAIEFARMRALEGKPTWVFLRQEPENAKSIYGGSQVVAIPSSRNAALKVEATISCISTRVPRAVFLVQDTSYLVSNCGFAETREVLEAIALRAKKTGCIVLASFSGLTSSERRGLARLPGKYWKLPVLEEEIVAIVESEIGPAALHLLRLFCDSRRIRLEDLRVAHIPELQAFLSDTLMTLSLKPSDSRLMVSGRSQTEALSSKLAAYGHMSLASIAEGPWQSAASRNLEGGGWLVRATDFHLPGNARNEKGSYGGKIRNTYKEVLGKGGEAIYKQALRIIGATEAEIGPEDLATLIRTTEEIFGVLECYKDGLRDLGKMIERSPGLWDKLEALGGGSNA